MDSTLDKAEEAVVARRAHIVEHDANRMAHHIVAYVLERAEAGHDPADLGAAMVQGAELGEDESGGILATPVVEFLEKMLAGAKGALSERKGADEIVLDPVAHVVTYFLSHGRFPESATPQQIAKAKAALAAGQSGERTKYSIGSFI